jgi:hypothetical protein
VTVRTSRIGLLLAGLAAVFVVGLGALTFASTSDNSGAQSAAKKKCKKGKIRKKGKCVKKTTGFTPAKIAGKWTGTWKNNTFGSTGDVRADVSYSGGKLMAVVDFGGNVFGCSDPGPETFTAPKGSADTSWSSSGFKVKANSPAFGDMSFTYTYKTKAVEATGSNACQPGLSWKLNGKLDAKTFSATVDINLPGGQTAQSAINASRP